VDAVVRNRSLPAGWRLTLSPSRQWELRAERLITEESDVSEQVRGMVEAFRHVGENDSPFDIGPAVEQESLERCCEEAGWAGVRRNTGRWTVSLETDPLQQATLTAFAHGVRLEIETADLGGASETCRGAAALLALEATSATRCVRASADPGSGAVRLEMVWPGLPLADELNAGLGLLSAVVRMAGSSFNALQIESLAADYLSIRGCSAKRSNPRQKQRRKQKKG